MARPACRAEPTGWLRADASSTFLKEAGQRRRRRSLPLSALTRLRRMTGRISLQRALLGTVAIAILVGVVPAGVALDRRLESELVTRARSDLEMAAGMIPGQGDAAQHRRAGPPHAFRRHGARRAGSSARRDHARYRDGGGRSPSDGRCAAQRACESDRRRRPHAPGGDRVAREATAPSCSLATAPPS